MRKIPSVALTATVFAALCAAPAFADDPGSAKSILLAPFSLVAGCAVGTPISAVRHTKKTFSKLFSALDQDNFSYKFWGGQCAILLAVPVGAIEGCYFGPKNSVVNCASKPFSKDAFSLGETP